MKTIIVTGSASGFGLLTVKTLAKQGHTVYATMRNVHSKNAAAAKAIEDWAREHHADVRVVELDITSDESVNRAVAHIVEESGKIDVLINNAGAFIWGLYESNSTKQLEQVFQVNVFGSDRMNKAVLPYMHRENNGLIIQIASGLSRLHLPFLGAYSASKVAIDALAETLRYELRETGIDSVVVQPGAYPATDLFSKHSPSDNITAAEQYGDFGNKIASGIAHLFKPGTENPDPVEVADLLAELILQTKEARKTWSAIGLGGGQATIETINATTEGLSLHLQSALGIIAQ